MDNLIQLDDVTFVGSRLGVYTEEIASVRLVDKTLALFIFGYMYIANTPKCLEHIR